MYKPGDIFYVKDGETVQDALKRAMEIPTNKVQHGHPRFYELTALEEDLHSRKNEDYAGGGSPMGNFERVSAFLAQYPNFPVATPHGTAIVYMMKQLDAALWLIANNKKGNIEGVAERFGDIGVYAKIIRILYEESQK